MWQEFLIDKAWATLSASLLGLAVGWGLGALSRWLPRRLEQLWEEQRVEAGGRPRVLPVVDWRADWRLGARGAVLAVLTASLFALCIWRLGPTPIAVCGMALVAALVALAWIDAETGLLPDLLTLPLVWLGLLVNLHGALAPLTQAVLGAVAGYLFLWLIFHAFRLVTGREGMGHGDFKLMAALGAWFGLAAAPSLLLGASLAGVTVGLALRLSGRLGRWQALPFGPYLAAGGILMLLVGVPLGRG